MKKIYFTISLIILIISPLFLLLAENMIDLSSFNYSNACRHCHGKNGDGKGPASMLLPIKTPDWAQDKPAFLKDEDTLAKKLKSLMGKKLKAKRHFPHFTVSLTNNELKSMAMYMKKHQGLEEGEAPVLPPNYGAVYRKACAYCHGIFGNGRGLVNGFTKKPLNFRSQKYKNYSTDKMYELLLKSKTKKIHLRKSISHFPESMGSPELNKIKQYFLGEL